MKYLLLAGAMLYFVSIYSYADCFSQAGARYQIDPHLLKAISLVESEAKPYRIGVNKNKQGKIISRDYGLMQINDVHIPELIKLGIIRSHDDLLKDSCLNIFVGAWVLARHFQICGKTWDCLGSYNAGFNDNNNEQRRRYAKRVFLVWKKIKE